MITALEGYKFLAPKGIQAIRPQDHAMLQPMFRVKLVNKNGHLAAVVTGTASTYDTAPPIVAMKG
jgi:branched-chain amino acid transport system substrate-binding protein